MWCFMTGFHAAIMKLTESQYPLAYWISTAYQCPSPKLGLAMAIAARPLPLLAYLVTLWPLLPGSLNVVDVWMRSQSPLRQRLARALAIAAGCLFVVGHGCLLSIGYFWEST